MRSFRRLMVLAVNVTSRALSSNLMRKSTIVQLYYNDVYEVILPTHHRFPMIKYKLVREMLQKEYATNLDVRFAVSPQATFDELSLTHCPRYVENFMQGNLTPLENRRIGFPWSMASVQRATSSAGGTVAAMRTVLESENGCQAACHLAGGTHHAFYDYGEGFCVFSDIAVAANLALAEFRPIVKKILIIDLDTHQGNGNAKLFQENPNVFTFSMHCRANYFSDKQESDIDVELDANCRDDEYLNILSQWLDHLLVHVRPQLVFFQAGVDVHEHDRLGKMKLTREGISRRNMMVYQAVKQADAKLVVTMGGG